MFTGLIEEIGTIRGISPIGNGRKITVECKKVLEGSKIDDSIAINGACQTVVSLDSNSFTVVAVEETIKKSTLGSLKIGAKVNLERAMRLSDRLGGHLVQGHVDTVGKVSSIEKQTASTLYRVSYEPEFSKYLVHAGSITVNGISLTTASVDSKSFMLSIIPHTFENTTLKFVKIGDNVNLEFDILGKYVDKILSSKDNKPTSILTQFIDQPEY